MRPVARLLPGGRLHLQHGPSDLILWAEGARAEAYAAAQARFETIIAEVVRELAEMREVLSPLTRAPRGAVAWRMHEACLPFSDVGYLTRMAAVAGAIADEVLGAMTAHADLSRAYVNNGGDIAVHLAPGTSFSTAVLGHDGADMGRITIGAEDGIGGIATSGRHGRSLSLGIADSLTVLAKSAAQADVAATLTANAVDLPGHSAITRRPATDVQDDSDLGSLPVVVGCGTLTPDECVRALTSGASRANHFQSQGLIKGAALFHQGQAVTTHSHFFPSQQETAHA